MNKIKTINKQIKQIIKIASWSMGWPRGVRQKFGQI